MTDTNPRELIQRLADALTNAIRIIYNEDGTQHISTATPVLDEARVFLSHHHHTGGQLMSNTCKYWDCGWCYALDNVETNADSQSACVNPFVCPYLLEKAMRPNEERVPPQQQENN